MLAAGMTRFLLHGGQSSVLARGDAWEVGLRNPVRPKQRLGVIRLSDRALGTSGIQFQAFRHEGRRYGHLLDPRTGWPVEGVLSTTVLAPTAALADALSTALFVIGPDKSADYCKRHPELGAVIVAEGPNGRVGELTVTGLGPDELTLGSDEEHVS
jgi:thiamine biosynthesis lipoprotein